jgi:hypothetical protein
MSEEMTLDEYKRLHQGWLKGNARGTATTELPVAIPGVVFASIIFDLHVTSAPGGWGRIFVQVYVWREN